MPKDRTPSPDSSEGSDPVNHVSLNVDPTSEPQLVHRRHSVGDSKNEKMNGSYDGPLSVDPYSPATVDVDAMETVSLGRLSRSHEENGISKGIILNAASFGQPNDTWLKDKGKDQEMTVSYFSSKLSEKPAVDPKTDGVVIPEKMTVLRKVVFGFSFLPSIMFVLCFAIILPCDEPPVPGPCVNEMWSLTLNDTELTSELTISADLLVGFWKDASGGVLNLKLDTGDTLWTWLVTSRPLKVDCKDFDVNEDGISDCLLVDSSGGLYAFNVSNGYVFWNSSIDAFDDQNPSLPIILSDCNKDGVREIAVAVSNSKIKIMSNGYWMYPDVKLTDCRTIPSNLVPWTHEGVTDLVFYCQKADGNGTVNVMRQSTWCSPEAKLTFPTVELLNSFSNRLDLNETLLVPTDDGLVGWAEDRVFLFRTDGVNEWQSSSKNHSAQRFLMYGNFYEKEKQVALISGDMATGAMVTLLNSASGNETLTWSLPDAEVMNAVLVSRENTDYLLMMLKVIRVVKEENAFSTNISLLSANDNIDDGIYNLPPLLKTKIIPEVVILEFQKQEPMGTGQENRILTCDKEDVCNLEAQATKLTAFVKEKELIVVMGRTLVDDKRSNFSTELRSLKVDEWYKSAKSSAHCS